MGDKIRLNALLQTFFALARRYGAMIALVTLALAAFDTVLEVAMGSSFQLVGNIVSMIALFYLLAHLLRSEGLVEHEGGFGRYFGASLLSGLGMVVGVICLVLPGLYLAARWSAATSLAITRDLSASEALGASWELTKASAWTLTLIYIVLLVVYVALVFGTVLGATVATGSESGIVYSGVSNLVVNLGVVLNAAFTVAVYIELTGRRSEAEAVFA